MANNTEGVVKTPCSIRKGGRPRVAATCEEARKLRDQGLSYGRIARVLGISKSSAERLCRATIRATPGLVSSGTSQNSRQQGTGPSPAVRALRPPLRLKRIPEADGPITPNAGQPPGRCPDCGGRAWRQMPGGAVCSLCHPLSAD